MQNTGEQLSKERDKMEGQRQEEQRQQVRLEEERTLFEEERRKFEQEKRKLKDEAQRKCAEEKHLLEKERARKAKELEKQLEEVILMFCYDNNFIQVYPKKSNFIFTKIFMVLPIFFFGIVTLKSDAKKTTKKQRKQNSYQSS